MADPRPNPRIGATDTEGAAVYLLRLYVAGLTGRSLSAIASVKKACDEHLSDRYELEVINIYDCPTAAKDEHIVAAPTLIKKLPLPLRRIIGDMAEDKLLARLSLRSARCD